MPEATWEPHEKHGRLTTKSDLPDTVFAFPKQRKEPLTGAQHVRNAVARFDEVIDVSDDDRALAFANIFGRLRVSGQDPEHRSYRSFASFSDPCGHGWLLQEITTRIPGRIDSAPTSFGSVSDLSSALRRAEAAHGEHEKRTGKRYENWPDWYAACMVAEQAGTELPQ